jgi:hypothetical protein
MGRPPLNSTGPMTATERSKKRYARLKKSINLKIKRRRKRAKESEGREATRLRREASLAALPIDGGLDYRVGDCREVLVDIADNSIPLILTDPPYGMKPEAELLYRWLAEFAARVLIPGGALVCYTGLATEERDKAIFREHHPRLTLWPTCILPHDKRQKLQGFNLYANHKPILLLFKDGFRRKAAHGKVTKLASVVRSVGDKGLHEWGQGDGGVQQWIHQLTEPGETIVDPFAGPAEWGRIAWEAGRRWIGCDVVRGGSPVVVV